MLLNGHTCMHTIGCFYGTCMYMNVGAGIPRNVQERAGTEE